MSASSIAADHSEEFEQLAGLSALRVLDTEEEVRFEEHARQCERCRTIVLLDRAALANLALTAPDMDPSPDFKARLMQRAAAELAASEAAAAPPEPIPLRPRPANVVPLWRRSVWASALAALLVIGVATAGVATYLNQTLAVYQVAQGQAQMTVVVRRSGAVELEMHGVSDPPPGFVYEAWVIPPGRQPVAVGITPSGEARMPLPPEAHGSTVAVTLERGPQGSPQPTSPPLMAVVVSA